MRAARAAGRATATVGAIAGRPLARVVVAALVMASGVALVTLRTGVGFVQAPAHASTPKSDASAPRTPDRVADDAIASLVTTLATGEAADDGAEAETGGVPRPDGARRLYRGSLEDRMSLTVYATDGDPETALQVFATSLAAHGFKPHEARSAERGRRTTSRTFTTPHVHAVVTASRGESGALLTIVETWSL